MSAWNNFKARISQMLNPTQWQYEIRRLRLELAVCRGEIHALEAERDGFKAQAQERNNAYLNDRQIMADNVAQMESYDLRIDDMESELAQSREQLAQWQNAAGAGHPSPCTLGLLCPYCEIESLKADCNQALKNAKDRLPDFAWKDNTMVEAVWALSLAFAQSRERLDKALSGKADLNGIMQAMTAAQATAPQVERGEVTYVIAACL